MSSITPTEAGRIIAALRRTEPRHCEVCGAVTIGTTRRKYCSDACRLRADYARHAERRKAERRERYQRQKASKAAESEQ